MLDERRYYIFFSALLLLYFTAMPVLAVAVPKPIGVVLMVIAGLLLPLRWAADVKWRLDKGLASLSAFLLLALAAGAFMSPQPAEALGQLYKVGLFTLSCIILVTAVKSSPQGRLEACVRYLPISVLIGIGVLLLSTLQDYALYRFFRPDHAMDKVEASVLNRPAVFACLLAWPAALVLTRDGRGILAAGLILFILATMVYINSSQSALFGMLAGIGCWLLLAWQRQRRLLMRLMTLACICGLLFAPLIARGLYTWQPDFLKSMKVAAAMQRMTIWNGVAIESMASPLIGRGPEATKLLGENITRHTQDYPWAQVYHPHNFALQLWLEGGLAAVLAMCGLFWVICRRIEDFSPEGQRLAFSGFMCVVAVASTGYGLWQGWWMGAVLSVCLGYAVQVNKKSGEKPNGA